MRSVRVILLAAHPTVHVEAPMEVHARSSVVIGVRDEAADVSFSSKDVGDRYIFTSERLPRTKRKRILPSHQLSPNGDRRQTARIGILKDYAFLGELIDIWGLAGLYSFKYGSSTIVEAYVILAEAVEHNDDDIIVCWRFHKRFFLHVLALVLVLYWSRRCGR